MNKILCCDPSLTAFGWAVIENDKVIEGGCIKTKTSDKALRIRKSDDRMNRVSYIATTLKEIITTHNIKYIVSELPHGSQSAVAAIALGLVNGMLQGLADGLGIGIEWYSEGDSKFYLLSKRSAGKEETINKITTLYGDTWKKKDKASNEAIADSISIYHCAKRCSSAISLILTKE